MYFQTYQKDGNPCIPPPGLVKRVIYEAQINDIRKANREKKWYYAKLRKYQEKVGVTNYITDEEDWDAPKEKKKDGEEEKENDE